MKPDLQRRIQRYGWDKAAPHYDNGWQRQLWPAQQRLLAGADLKPGDRVLDISCGSGLVTLPIAEKVSPENITAVDLSEGMIDTARERAEQEGYENIAFRRMDAEDLHFDAHTFDKVICSLGIMYFPFPGKAVEEMHRVLKPGGSAHALVWGERGKCGWAEIFPIVDRRVQSEVCPLFFQQGTGNTLALNYESAGFEEITTDRFTSDLNFEDDDQACVAAFLGGAVAMAYNKFEQDTREEVHQEYLDSISEYARGDGYSVPGEFVIVTGIK